MHKISNDEAIEAYNASYGGQGKPLEEVVKELEALTKVRTVSLDLTRRVLSWDTTRN
ncbi:MAG: hypothetical protein J6M44_17390 [Butyrivibrio sp.]|uniref:hypothetical protein n=1 Tax=Butyrivibrio sp. TaxID=28121 RepID=UPI001B5837DC|nr:hypothetical protein [Butyrivibrio sp.]MBP3280723.1 hypothetical protein [Butyrivibrio sp.]MBP3782108.1 hypothetical protein [Butyrivibrio sp.]